MSIRVRCPNGHELNVKDQFAGKSGLCPQCQARIVVPAAGSLSDDDVLAIVGPPRKAGLRPPTDNSVHDDPEAGPSETESGVDLLNSSLMRRKKTCPNCHEVASFAFTVCPRCGTTLSQASVNLPPKKPK